MKVFSLNVFASFALARDRMYPLHVEHSFRMDSKEMSLPLGRLFIYCQKRKVRPAVADSLSMTRLHRLEFRKKRRFTNLVDHTSRYSKHGLGSQRVLMP